MSDPMHRAAPTANEDDWKTIARIVGKARIAFLTTVGDNGALHSRPLALPDEEFEGSISFLVQAGSEKVDDSALTPQVNVAVQDGDDYLSLAGTASVTRDQARIEALWSPFAEAWFPEGREDPSIRVLTVAVDTAEYWVSDATVFRKVATTARAMVGHGTPDTGENRAVDL